MREDAARKARRLLAWGRVRVLTADEYDGHVMAEIRGDSGRIYIAGHSEDGWFCDCAARSRCSHVRALQLITVMWPSR